MKLLHIDSSVLGPHSVSRQVSAAIVDRLAKATPGLEIVYRDLTLPPLAHLSGSHLAAGQGAVPEAALQPDLAALAAHQRGHVLEFIKFIAPGLLMRNGFALQGASAAGAEVLLVVP